MFYNLGPWLLVWPDLSLNFLQRVLADDTGRARVKRRKEKQKYLCKIKKKNPFKLYDSENKKA